MTTKFLRKGNLCAKILSSIDITSPNIFVSTPSLIFKDNCCSSRSKTIFTVTLFSRVVALVMKPQRSHWITSVQVPWRIFLLQCLHFKHFSIFCTEYTSLTGKVSSVSLSALSKGIQNGDWFNLEQSGLVVLKRVIAL